MAGTATWERSPTRLRRLRDTACEVVPNKEEWNTEATYLAGSNTLDVTGCTFRSRGFLEASEGAPKMDSTVPGWDGLRVEEELSLMVRNRTTPTPDTFGQLPPGDRRAVLKILDGLLARQKLASQGAGR